MKWRIFALGLGLAKISRIERKRAVTITADADASKVQSSSVIDDIRDNFIPQLLLDYPTVEFGVSGASQEESDLIGRLMIAGRRLTVFDLRSAGSAAALLCAAADYYVGDSLWFCRCGNWPYSL